MPINRLIWQGLPGKYLAATDEGLKTTIDYGANFGFLRPNADFEASWPGAAAGKDLAFAIGPRGGDNCSGNAPGICESIVSFGGIGGDGNFGNVDGDASPFSSSPLTDTSLYAVVAAGNDSDFAEWDKNTGSGTSITVGGTVTTAGNTLYVGVLSRGVGFSTVESLSEAEFVAVYRKSQGGLNLEVFAIYNSTGADVLTFTFGASQTAINVIAIEHLAESEVVGIGAGSSDTNVAFVTGVEGPFTEHRWEGADDEADFPIVAIGVDINADCESVPFGIPISSSVETETSGGASSFDLDLDLVPAFLEAGYDTSDITMAVVAVASSDGHPTGLTSVRYAGAGSTSTWTMIGSVVQGGCSLSLWAAALDTNTAEEMGETVTISFAGIVDKLAAVLWAFTNVNATPVQVETSSGTFPQDPGLAALADPDNLVVSFAAVDYQINASGTFQLALPGNTFGSTLGALWNNVNGFFGGDSTPPTVTLFDGFNREQDFEGGGVLADNGDAEDTTWTNHNGTGTNTNSGCAISAEFGQI